MNSSDFSALAASRHSTRDFRADPIPPDIWQDILDDLPLAPSWSNTRPYQLAIATGERAQRIKTSFQAAFTATTAAVASGGKLPVTWDFDPIDKYPPVLKERSKDVGLRLYEHLGIERSDKVAREAQTRRNFDGFGAPLLGFVFVHQGLMPFSALDAGILLQTLFLSAKAHGVDSCALGSLARWRDPVAGEFEIDPDYKFITGFALGYAADTLANEFRAPRPPVELVPFLQ